MSRRKLVIMCSLVITATMCVSALSKVSLLANGNAAPSTNVEVCTDYDDPFTDTYYTEDIWELSRDYVMYFDGQLVTPDNCTELVGDDSRYVVSRNADNSLNVEEVF